MREGQLLIYRVKVEGVITVYSEEALDRITQLAENEELFNYLSTLINTGSETSEVIKKLDLLLSSKGQTGLSAIPTVLAPSPENINSIKAKTSEPDVEKVVSPVKGSAAAVLNRMRKVNKNT